MLNIEYRTRKFEWWGFFVFLFGSLYTRHKICFPSTFIIPCSTFDIQKIIRLNYPDPLKTRIHRSCQRWYPIGKTKMGSLRQEIIRLIGEREMSARELSQILSIRERDVYDHMYHIEKTVKASEEELFIIQSHCLKCGFTFKNRKRISPPSRCPICKGEHIADPVFRISAKRLLPKRLSFWSQIGRHRT